ncbi:nuclear transport factor 2 family protein (plasmid) [Rhizobium sp. 32-5/1]|uniref:nuclear transport factor 2 family protein n=1 Tax=Rhizobium sp. 32-5/1 TaxID=3019602 RepID=UPI00240E96F8|nr:nuclear transport factor 2 family protein [Rhizobium sp. 32-5/1]WEZ85381.1 nuclear transport factor 2 family protein [Rhizobium sp. 32-5/1]
MSTALEDIRETLGAYFDALYFCDVDKLESVFHPAAVYATPDETPLLHRTMAEYFPIVAGRQSGDFRNDVRRDHIDAVDIVSDNVALARVRCSIGTRDFVDFLTLVRVDHGKWRIIAKIFNIIEPKR